MSTRGLDMAAQGPRTPTPLAVEFYKAWRASGLTVKQVAAQVDGASWQTVWAYINGTRGGSQRRSEPTIRQIAKALGVDEDRAVELSGIVPESGAEQAIMADPTISRADKQELVERLRRMQRRKR